MGDKKNIDRLFQEKFKDFDPVPDERLWKDLEGKLNSAEKKSRRVIPIWWRMAGVAAVLILLLTTVYFSDLFNTNPDQVPLPLNEKITDTEDKTEEPEATDKIIDIEPQEEQGVVNNSTEVESAAKNTVDKILGKEKINNNTAQGLVDKEEKRNRDTRPNGKYSIKKSDISKGVVSSDINEKSKQKDKIDKAETSKKLKSTTENTIAAVDQESKQKNADTKTITDNKKVIAANDENEQQQKKSIFDAIEDKEEVLEETAKSKNRWSLQPSVAPVFFNSLSGGSSIDPQFADNPKSGNLNLSYGLNVSYQISDRLSIRSGVSKVNYGYNTDDIALTSSPGELVAIENLSFSNQVSNIAIVDSRPGNNIVAQRNFDDATSFAISPEIDAVLTQELGYIEVPLELKYRLVDKKLGVNLIGGVSSLFLTDNAVFIDSEDFTTEIGEANNLNNMNFSTNVGIGVDYKISNKVLINIEPVFKYQLNTFSNDTGNFRPYSVGVYTGLSFKF